MSSPAHRYRVLVLPLAALVIAGLCWWRIEVDQQRRTAAIGKNAARPVRLAPRFELYDQKSQLVKFERYLGRTRIVLIFFDGEQGADNDPWLPQLRDHFDQLKAARIQVVGVGFASPYANRQAAERTVPFPFPICSDIGHDRPAPAHTAWGLFDPEQQVFRTGMFLIDRSGMVETERGRPRPTDDPAKAVVELIAGRWPAARP